MWERCARPRSQGRTESYALSTEQLAAAWHDLQCLVTRFERDRFERIVTHGVIQVRAYEMGVKTAVHESLAKLADGTYGRCEGCRGTIRPERLHVVPYARYCSRCQQQQEAAWCEVERLVGAIVRDLVGEPQGPAIAREALRMSRIVRGAGSVSASST
jgi:hypothetical protein